MWEWEFSNCGSVPKNKWECGSVSFQISGSVSKNEWECGTKQADVEQMVLFAEETGETLAYVTFLRIFCQHINIPDCRML